MEVTREIKNGFGAEPAAGSGEDVHRKEFANLAQHGYERAQVEWGRGDPAGKFQPVSPMPGRNRQSGRERRRVTPDRDCRGGEPTPSVRRSRKLSANRELRVR